MDYNNDMGRMAYIILVCIVLMAAMLIACGDRVDYTGPCCAPPPLHDEGSVSDPRGFILDGSGEADIYGQVGLMNSYYVVNGVTAGDYYHITLSLISNDVDLYVYNTPGFMDLLGSSSNSGTADESIIVNTTGTDLYIRVQSFDAPDGALFRLMAEHKPLVDEGTELAPVTLTGSVAHLGTVGLSNSYYAVPVTPGAHEIALTSREDNPEILYYDDDSGFMASKYTCTGTSPFSCLVTASSSVIYLAVNGAGTASGDVYDLTVSPYPGQTEGTPDAPVDITGPMPYSGSVVAGDWKYSYYSVDVSAATSYDVTLGGLSDDADLYVYLVPGFGVFDCYDFQFGTTSEVCTVTATGTTLYMMVENWADPDTVTYTINVTAN
jgi:hypothetical protein